MKRRAGAGYALLIIGVIMGSAFGRIDTMAGLVFLAILVIWQGRKKVEVPDPRKR